MNFLPTPTRVASLICSLLMLALTGCSRPVEYRITSESRPIDLETQSISRPLAFVGEVKSGLHTAGGWNVQGVAIGSELISEPVQVEASTVLSFMPFSPTRPSGPIELRLEAVTPRGTRLLYDSVFRDARMGPLEKEGIVNLDLSSMVDETISLRWQVEIPRTQDAHEDVVLGFARISDAVPGSALPNIIVICSDTHRADYGVGEHMPQLTRFAEDSVVFDTAIANSSWTIPSVVSFLTGLEPYRHGTGWRVEPNRDLMTGAGNPITRDKTTDFAGKGGTNVVLHNDRLLTLQDVLQSRGYLASAWVENRWIEFSGILADGFSQFVTPGALKTLDDHDENDRGGRTLEEHTRTFLQTRPPSVPFFLYLHSKHVHDFVSEPENIAANDGDRARAIGPPANRATTLPQKEYAALYAKRVREFDAQLGAVFDILREEGVYDDSMIVFYSDHGEQLMECDSGVGHGNALTETLLHVPLIVKAPASTGVAPAHIAETVQLIDVFPTVLDLLSRRGGDADVAGRNGRTLLPRMLDGTPLDPVLVQSGIQFFGDERVALRDERVKLISNLTTGESRAVDWTTDETCEEPLDDPGVVQTLTQRLGVDIEFLLTVVLNGEPGSLDSLTEEQRKELEALGYLN